MQQTWGYRADGAARIFDLEDGETLPAGWSDTPAVIEDESKRTAEALSDALRMPIDDGDDSGIEPVAAGEVRRRRGRPPKPQAEG